MANTETKPTIRERIKAAWQSIKTWWSSDPFSLRDALDRAAAAEMAGGYPALYPHDDLHGAPCPRAGQTADLDAIGRSIVKDAEEHKARTGEYPHETRAREAKAAGHRKPAAKPKPKAATKRKAAPKRKTTKRKAAR